MRLLDSKFGHFCFAAACALSFSPSAVAQQPKVDEPPREYFPNKFDEIPAFFSWSDVIARLDNVAIRFQRERSDIVLYLLSYAGRRTCVGQADQFNLRAKSYLVRRGVASRRVILIDGGYLEKPRLDVWMLPNSVSPPDADPNIDRALVHVSRCATRAAKRRRA